MSNPIVSIPANISRNSLVSPNNQEASGILLTVDSSPINTAEQNKRFALVTSVMIANKTAGSVIVNAVIRNGTDAKYILYKVAIPNGTSFELIQGNKFILKEGDSLRVWHESVSGGTNVIDVVTSYVIHNPVQIYDA